MKQILGIIIGGFVIVILALVFTRPGADPAEVGVGDVRLTPSNISFEKLSEFTFKDYNGNDVKLTDLSLPLVVNSWAAWCPFCVKELPDFAITQEEFGSDVTIVAIDRSEPLSTAKEFSDRVGVTDKLVMLLDSGDNFYRSIGGFSMPETIFIDVDGSVKDHKRGPMTTEEMSARIIQAFGLANN